MTVHPQPIRSTLQRCIKFENYSYLYKLQTGLESKIDRMDVF